MPGEKLALSVTEAAAMLNISRPKMYDLIHSSDFDAVFRIGSRTLISRPRLERWIDRQCGGESDADK